MSHEINSHLDRLKESFLCAAARGGRLQECASLLDLGAEVEWSEGDEDTPLLAAVRNGHKDVAALLLAHGANPLQRDLEGNSVLHLAAAIGDEGMASLLSPNAGSLSLSTNDDGMTAIDVAVQRGFNSFAEHLHNLLYGVDVEEKEDASASEFPTNALSLEDEMEAALSAESEEDSTHDDSTVDDLSSPADAGESEIDHASTSILLGADVGHLPMGTTLLDTGESSYEDVEVLVDETDDSPDAVMNQLRHMTELAHSQSSELYQAKYALNQVMQERNALEKEQALFRGEDDALANKSLSELTSLEEQVKLSLEKITKAKQLTSSNLEEERVCVICREIPKSVLLLPCRHLCVCAECGHLDVLVQCPLCREPITERINVFA